MNTYSNTKKTNTIDKDSIMQENNKHIIKNSPKKIISLFLAFILICGIFTTSASAAYSTGTFRVNTSSGVNVRSGPGVNYSRVGAATNGTTFNVSKTSGSWGFTNSIKCTNGYKSGWVCLDYCSKQGGSSGGNNNSNRSTYNDVFASLKGSGYSLSQARNSESTSFRKGDFVYVWAWLHDANSNLYKSYGSGTCNMTLSIYRPDGSCKYTYTYKNSDNNWIGCQLDQAGTWKIQSKITGSLMGTNTHNITVKNTSSNTYYTLSYNANGGYSAPSSQRVKANTNFYLSSSKPYRSGYTFLGWSLNRNASSASYSAGAGVRINSNVTLYAVWQRNSYIQITGGALYAAPKVGDIYYLGVSAYPSNTGKLTWSSSNSSVVSINSNGKMTAKKAGSARITVKASDGRTASCTINVSAKNTWRTGGFGGYNTNDYTTVYLNKNAGNAYIKLHTYNSVSNWETKGQMHVVLRDINGSFIWEGDVSAKSTLKLGNDHSAYRVYISWKRYPNTIIGNGDDFTNRGACGYWGIECTKNCYI